MGASSTGCELAMCWGRGSRAGGQSACLCLLLRGAAGLGIAGLGAPPPGSGPRWGDADTPTPSPTPTVTPGLRAAAGGRWTRAGSVAAQTCARSTSPPSPLAAGATALRHAGRRAGPVEARPGRWKGLVGTGAGMRAAPGQGVHRGAGAACCWRRWRRWHGRWPPCRRGRDHRAAGDGTEVHADTGRT